MERFDFVFAGGGLAGLSLACRLACGPLADRSMLVVDIDDKQDNDRTWAYWADRHTPFDALVYHSWEHLRFIGNGSPVHVQMQGYRYKMIRGLDFYRHTHTWLKALPNVTFVRGRVRAFEDGEQEARMTVDGNEIAASWVFDSTRRPVWQEPDERRYNHLHLHFHGWEIQTAAPAFDPQVATLMDFRTPQEGETRFFYVLPFDPHRALVEYTIFSTELQSHAEYEQAIRAYITRTLGINAFEVTAEEGGDIPITDQPYPRKVGRRIVTIGTKGGRIKPSTGYAYARIQHDSEAIARSLERHGHPFNIPRDSQRHRMYDAMLLRVMRLHGEQTVHIFDAMFRYNPIERIFRFLDEIGGPQDDFWLVSTLPKRLFLSSLV